MAIRKIFLLWPILISFCFLSSFSAAEERPFSINLWPLFQYTSDPIEGTEEIEGLGPFFIWKKDPHQIQWGVRPLLYQTEDEKEPVWRFECSSLGSVGGEQMDDPLGRSGCHNPSACLQSHRSTVVGGGATLGALSGAQVAAWGRRASYFLISLGSVTLTSVMFVWTAPLQPSFLPVVCAQGFVTTLFFGWLPLYLHELFPTRARASGMGLSYNVGRFATAIGVLLAGSLFAALGGSYSRVGFFSGLIYALGMVIIWWAPDTTGKSLAD